MRYLWHLLHVGFSVRWWRREDSASHVPVSEGREALCREWGESWEAGSSLSRPRFHQNQSNSSTNESVKIYCSSVAKVKVCPVVSQTFPKIISNTSQCYLLFFQTLDQLPLTNPEHFGTPVINKKSNRGRRSSQAVWVFFFLMFHFFNQYHIKDLALKLWHLSSLEPMRKMSLRLARMKKMTGGDWTMSCWEKSAASRTSQRRRAAGSWLWWDL